MFVFSTLAYESDDTITIAIYCYAQKFNENGGKVSQSQAIPVKAAIDRQGRHLSKQTGGLMTSATLIVGNTATLFVPHSVINLPTGRYEFTYRVAVFKGNSIVESYDLDIKMPVDVEQKKGVTTIPVMPPTMPSNDTGIIVTFHPGYFPPSINYRLIKSTRLFKLPNGQVKGFVGQL